MEKQKKTQNRRATGDPDAIVTPNKKKGSGPASELNPNAKTMSFLYTMGEIGTKPLILVDSLSILFNHRSVQKPDPFAQDFWWCSRKKDPWKEWGSYP